MNLDKNRGKKRQRQRIMTAARKIFINKGFNGTSMAEIAKAAAVGTGTIYIHFKNKQDLYASLTVRVLRYLSDRLDTLNLEMPASVDEQMQRLKVVLMELYDYDPPILINMFNLQSSRSMRNISLELLNEINALWAEMLDKMIDILKNNLKEKSFNRRHAVVLANILWGLFTGVILKAEMNNVMNPCKDSVHQKFDLAFDIFLRGIDASPAMEISVAT